VHAILHGWRKRTHARQQRDSAHQHMTRAHDARRQDARANQPSARHLAVILARVTQTNYQTPAVGDPAPDFSLPSTDDRDISLADFRGKQALVLYFYPRDDTPGCTAEACSFRDLRTLFQQHGAEILGVSTDKVRSHKKFQQKFGLTFPLLADVDHAVADKYGVWQQRKFMGREYMGIARTTFVIDSDGRIKAVFPNVKVEGHADKVLEALQA
jgi:peroxiredoxin Q/BCP